MSNDKKIEKTLNKLFAVGKLKKKEIEFTRTKTSNKEVARGRLVLLINKPDGKVGEVSIKVEQYREDFNGGENSNYKALQTISQTYKSVEEFGMEEADTIKIDGRIEENIYFSDKKNQLMENIELKAFYISRVAATEPHHCKVCFEGYISKVEPVQGGALNVEIIGITAKGIALPLNGEIPANLVVAFQNKYKVGCTTTLNFSIDNEVEVTTLQSEVGFGESIGEKIEKHIDKRTIFGGGAVLYPGATGAMKEDEVQKAIALREVEKENAKNNSNNETPTNAGGLQSGFNAGGVGTDGFGFNNSSQGGFNAGGFNAGGFNTNGFNAGGFGTNQ